VHKHGGSWANLATGTNDFGVGLGSGENTGVAEGSGGDTDVFGDGLEIRTIVLPGLVGKTEEAKEDEGADNHEPTGKLEGDFADGSCSPEHGRELVYTRESRVGVGPAFPWPDTVSVEPDSVGSEGDGAKDFNASEAHEAHISAGSEVIAVAGKKVVELRAALVELADAQNPIDSGNKADGDGWAHNKKVGDPSVVCEWVATDVFVDVETMTLGDVLKNHDQDGNTKADRKIDHDIAPFLSFGNSHGSH